MYIELIRSHFESTDSSVAPALQAAQTELQKAQLEDRLEGRLERRPDREDLERRGIVSISSLLFFCYYDQD